MDDTGIPTNVSYSHHGFNQPPMINTGGGPSSMSMSSPGLSSPTSPGMSSGGIPSPHSAGAGGGNIPQVWLPDGFRQIFRLCAFGPSGLKDNGSTTLSCKI